MRTVIYVHEPSTIKIRTTDSRDSDVLLCRYNRGTDQVPTGTHQLGIGIYLVVSHGKLEISGGNVTVDLLSGDKDLPPEPRFVALEPGASAASIKQFLEVAKGITVGSAPAAPVSPGTSKIKNDPDGI